MKNCILCSQPTEGSIGAAGIRWQFICQNCKNEEDELLERKIKYEGEVLNMLMEKLSK